MTKVFEIVETNVRAEVRTVEEKYYFVSAAVKKNGSIVSMHKEVNSLSEALYELSEFTKEI